MNSMNKNVEKLVEDLKSTFNLISVDHVSKDQVSFDFNDKELHSALSHMKSIGWTQLSMITCVDWIEDNQFQLVYILFNWEEGIKVQIRTRIDRDEGKFRTITNIYPGAKYYERDIHEFFGIVFDGNPESVKQLFLENWDDMPPLRKDFDPKAYSDRKYEAREYKANYNNTKVGETV